MPHAFARKAAATVALSRTILANTAAGLITAALLGFCSPALKKAEPVQPESVGRLNIDPVSGKLLDRVAMEEAPALPQPRLKPVLVGYALPALNTAPDAEAAPQKAKKAALKTSPVSKVTKLSASEPESRNMPAQTPEAELAAAAPAESEGWMLKLVPGALSARLAPVGGYVSGSVAAAKRAVADRLETIGF